VLFAPWTKAEEGDAMTDDEKKRRNSNVQDANDAWEKIRSRTILAAFQTGRPVFANTEGELRYADGDCEPVADEVGESATAIPEAKVHITWRARLWRWFGKRAP
jgi:hypothetical protein